MSDISSYEKLLKNNPNADKLMQAANTPEGQRIMRMFDAKEVEKAAKSGDAEALKSMMNRLLSTPEGRDLAAKVQKAMQNK